MKLKALLIALSLFCFTCTAKSAMIFYDDFESGDLSGWDGGDVTTDCYTDVVNTQKHNGNYSLEIKDGSNGSWAPIVIDKFINVKEFYWRVYLYLPAGFYTGLTDSRTILRIESRDSIFVWGTSSCIYLDVANWGSGNMFYLATSTTSSQSATYDGVQEGAWYCIELKIPQCASNSVIRWWVNGTEQQAVNVNLSSFNNWGTLYMGSINGGPDTWNKTMYYDDVEVADSYIGPVASPYSGNFQFSRAAFLANEGSGKADISVKRRGGSSGAVSVQYATENGTAGSSDYTSASGILTWNDGDTADKKFTVNINNDSTVEKNETFFVKLQSPGGGAELGSIIISTVCVIDNDSPIGIKPNPMISRGKPAYASHLQANASKVVDGVYSEADKWKPGVVPAWIAINVGTGYSKLMMTWFYTSTNNFNDYDNENFVPENYTIEASADSTNGSDGTWQTVATVTGNTYKTREHSFDFTGKSWVRMNVSQATAAGWGIDEIDIHDISNGNDDSLIFIGDSISRGAYSRVAAKQPDYASVIHSSYTAYYPAMIGAGNGGWLASDYLNIIDEVLANNPDYKYWCIHIGGNDLKTGGGYGWHDNDAMFKSIIQRMVEKVFIAGHVPIPALMTYSDPGVFPEGLHAPAFNNAISEVIAENGLKAGPNFYPYIQANPQLLADGMHLTPAGYVIMNHMWADTMEELYDINSDSTVPANVTAVRDGTGADISTTKLRSTLSANWEASSDLESGILKYLYAIGTTQGGTELLDWTDNGVSTAVIKTGLTLTIGTKYYFSIKAVNGAGLPSAAAANSDGQTVEQDDTAPSAPASVRDGTSAVVDSSFTVSKVELSANWSAAADDESGIDKYYYAIGTAAGGTDIIAWTDNGTATAVTKTGLTLTGGTKYYFSVKAENGASLQSAATNSNGQVVEETIIIITPPPSTGTVVTAGVSYPNPYSLASNQTMKISIGNNSGGEISIYTTSGKLVRKLSVQPGSDKAEWDGKNESGEKVAREIYIYTVTPANGSKVTHKFAVTK